MLSNFRFSLL